VINDHHTLAASGETCGFCMHCRNAKASVVSGARLRAQQLQHAGVQHIAARKAQGWYWPGVFSWCQLVLRG
jgi:hypothetical protein